MDELTGETLPNSDVNILKNGVLYKAINTRKVGLYSQELMLGYYYFIGAHEGYENGELGTYVNRVNNNVTIALRKSEIIEEETVLIIEEPEIVVEIEDEIIIIPEIIEDTIPVIVEDVYEEELYPNFSMKDYKPNNVVFLVDVSSSMNQGGRFRLTQGFDD